MRNVVLSSRAAGEGSLDLRLTKALSQKWFQGFLARKNRSLGTTHEPATDAFALMIVLSLFPLERIEDGS
jgi:hypothetical protein